MRIKFHHEIFGISLPNLAPKLKFDAGFLKNFTLSRYFGFEKKN
jgi:hypothetical protein